MDYIITYCICSSFEDYGSCTKRQKIVSAKNFQDAVRQANEIECGGDYWVRIIGISEVEKI